MFLELSEMRLKIQLPPPNYGKKYVLGLDKKVTPPKEWIDERIKVLEHYRKLRKVEIERYCCGTLRLIYERYSVQPQNHELRREFVVNAFTWANIPFPDPEKHPGRLDDWIDTPVETLSPEVHHLAAQQAAIKS
jgi:hypothetical protein